MRVTQEIWPLFPLNSGCKTRAPKLRQKAGTWEPGSGWSPLPGGISSGGNGCTDRQETGFQVVRGVGGVPRSRGLFSVPFSSAFSLKSSQLCYQPVFCSNGDSHSSFHFFFLNKHTIALDSLSIMKPYWGVGENWQRGSLFLTNTIVLMCTCDDCMHVCIVQWPPPWS